MRTKLFIVTALLSFNSFANNILSMNMDEFYAIEENQKMYEQMLKNGKIELAREQFKKACVEQAKNEKELGYCSCAAPEIDKMDGKILLYDSLFSFHAFKAKVEAKQSGNETEYKRLQKISNEREGLTKSLEKKCGEI
jgi:hypothetical protein